MKVFFNIVTSTILYFLIIFSCQDQDLFAQNKPFSISFGGGAGYVPLKDVVRFTDNAPFSINDGGRKYDLFEKDDHGKFGFLKIAYHIDNTWGTSLLFETINISAKGKSTHINFAGFAGTADENWEFTAVPISVLYEFFFRGRDNWFSPVVGFGPSLYVSKMVKKDVFTSANSEIKSFSEIKDTQIGYGLLLFFELQNSYNRFFINSRIQTRLAKGMNIPDRQMSRTYKVDFNSVDLTLGFGWRF